MKERGDGELNIVEPWRKLADKYSAGVARRTFHSMFLEADCGVSDEKYKEVMAMLEEMSSSDTDKGET